MTKDDVIRLAKEAGFIIHEFQSRQWIREPHPACDLDPNLEAFAKLIAQHEREMLAKHFDNMPSREMFGGTVADEIRARGEK